MDALLDKVIIDFIVNLLKSKDLTTKKNIT